MFSALNLPVFIPQQLAYAADCLKQRALGFWEGANPIVTCDPPRACRLAPSTILREVAAQHPWGSVLRNIEYCHLIAYPIGSDLRDVLLDFEKEHGKCLRLSDGQYYWVTICGQTRPELDVFIKLYLQEAEFVHLRLLVDAQMQLRGFLPVVDADLDEAPTTLILQFMTGENEQLSLQEVEFHWQRMDEITKQEIKDQVFAEMLPAENATPPQELPALLQTISTEIARRTIRYVFTAVDKAGDFSEEEKAEQNSLQGKIERCSNSLTNTENKHSSKISEFKHLRTRQLKALEDSRGFYPLLVVAVASELVGKNVNWLPRLQAKHLAHMRCTELSRQLKQLDRDIYFFHEQYQRTTQKKKALEAELKWAQMCEYKFQWVDLLKALRDHPQGVVDFSLNQNTRNIPMKIIGAYVSHRRD